MEKYELAEIDYKKGMKYKDIADKYEVSLNTVKSWKTRYWGKKKVCTQNKKGMHTKKVKEVAKALIETGHSISEVSKQTQVPKGTIANWSAKENLQQSQLEHLKAFRDKQRERILKNKAKRLDVNEVALEAIQSEIESWGDRGGISKGAMEKLMLNEKLEQDVLELHRIDMLEKQKIEDTNSDEKQTIEIVVKHANRSK